MLKIEKLKKIYKNSDKGVHSVTFQVASGEIVCLAGPNGSGKTTLLNSFLGITSKDAGDIFLGNAKVRDKDIKEIFAYVSDEILVIEELTGREYLLFLKSLSQDVSDETIFLLLELFDLEEAIDKLISSYSHGMKKKIQLISLLMKKFEVLILDEPCRGLDAEAVYVLKKLILELKKRGKMILITSHDLLFIEDICDRILILANGEIIEDGTPETVKKKYGAKNVEEAFLKASFLEKRGKKIELLLQDYVHAIKDAQE